MLARATFRMIRRRRLAALGAMTLATLWVAIGTIAVRHERLGGAGAARQAFDAILVMVWCAALVLPAYAAAVKPKPVRAGAIVAFVLGPVLMPLLFGRGWGWGPSLVAALAVAAALAPTPGISSPTRR